MLEREWTTPPRTSLRRRLAARVDRVDWLRWELGAVIALHGGFGLIIALAPEALVITDATSPMFTYLHRPGMAAFFLAVAFAATTCWLRPTGLRQLLTWVGVAMLGAGWITGFALAIRDGHGGLYGVVVWSVLLTLWTSTAVRLGLRSED